MPNPNVGRKTSQNELKGRIPDNIGIDERSHEVDGRLVPGHWEGDMIMGAGKRSAIGTLVERVARCTLLVKLEFKDTDYTCMSFAKAINNYSELLRRSMTYDQGKDCPSKAHPRDCAEPRPTSATRGPRGRGAPTKTRTVCSDSTFRRERICPYSLRTNSTESMTSSTVALSKYSTGIRRRWSSTNLFH